MAVVIRRLCSDEQGQTMAEYALILAVILLITVGTLRWIGLQIFR